MRPKYEETIEIIPKVDGTLVVSLSWRDHTFTEDLPRNIDLWPAAEYKNHIKSFVIPKLRLQLLKVQKNVLETEPELAENLTPHIELDQNDVDNMNKAQAKRDRKAAKLKVQMN